MSVKWKEAAVIVTFPILVILGLLLHQAGLDRAARRREMLKKLDDDGCGCSGCCTKEDAE